MEDNFREATIVDDEDVKRPGLFKKLLAIIGILVSVIYILNPTAGLIEIIPDNLPIVGNLDEAFFVYLLLACSNILGWNFLPKIFNKSNNAN